MQDFDGYKITDAQADRIGKLRSGVDEFSVTITGKIAKDGDNAQTLHFAERSIRITLEGKHTVGGYTLDIDGRLL